ncbi:MAG: hypothetical protein WCY11_16295 [Novosphingobium sp.]
MAESASATLETARTIRNAARTQFDSHLALVKADLQSRGVGGRIADTAKEEALAAFNNGIEVAKESKGIIAGTIAVLALWLLRNPLLDHLEDFIERANSGEKETNDA